MRTYLILGLAVAGLMRSALVAGQGPSSGAKAEERQPTSLRTVDAHTTPERVKDLLMATVFTTCPAPNAPPTVFYYRPMQHLLTEYKNAWSRLIMLKASEADKLNGIQYNAWLIVGGSASREFGTDGKWRPWIDASDLRPMVDRVMSGGLRPSDAMTTIDAFGVRVDIEKKHDRWSFDSRGSTINPDDFIKSKLSCAAAMSASPLN